MHLVYVDESGDIGLTNSPTREYLLVAIMVPEECWHGALTEAPNVQGPSERLIEDPVHIDSRHSRFIQLSDLLAYLLRQSLQPNAHFRHEQPRQLVRMARRLTGGIIWA